MANARTFLVAATTLVFSLAGFGFGWYGGSLLAIAGGAVGLCYVLLDWLYYDYGRRRVQAAASPVGTVAAEFDTPPPAVRREPVDPNDTAALVEQMLAQGRYALLLRRQVVGNLGAKMFSRTVQALTESMALVPEGEVALGPGAEPIEPETAADRAAVAAVRVVRVEAFLLDRHPVTNRQYGEFVAAGGYQQMALWDEGIWPAVLQFVDRTDHPGPRYWSLGCCPAGEENHPVVGVSWYEAAAYARWVGKRLPTDAEWVKAGSWPVGLGGSQQSQRRYPWGDLMDRGRANLWGSGPEQLVAVDRYAEGASVGGVCQLIGNVWEWTSGNFRAADRAPTKGWSAGELLLPAALKSIRGGAFDTYFDNQATCQFQSGENPLQRRHNIGFRCAVGLCDLQLAQPQHAADVPSADPPAADPVSEIFTAAAEEVPA